MTPEFIWTMALRWKRLYRLALRVQWWQGECLTFVELAKVFKEQHGYEPRRDLPFMPISDLDLHRCVPDVPVERLHHEPPDGRPNPEE